VALTPDGEELGRQRVPTPTGDYRQTIEAIVDLVASVDEVSSPTASTVGIGTPGTISPVSGVIKNSNSTVLNGKPLHRDLARALNRPVVMRNDADCFALSEARDGGGAGASVVMGVIIGTGVGGGIAVDGKTLSGPNGVTGEWGHNQLPWAQPPDLPGAPCYCGKRGCIETFLSGPGFERDFRQTTGRGLSAPQIVEEARLGAVEATIALHLYVDRLARALASIINVLDPDVVVAGGGMSNISEIYELVPHRWSTYVFGNEVTTRLVPNVHGDSSGVRGAAWLVET
jgi:fructokinase